MENLLLPIIIATPLFVVLALYRSWQLLARRLAFRAAVGAAFYKLLIAAVLVGYVYLGFHFFRCVWPGRCSEGFASGYVATGILFVCGLVSVGYLLSEVLLAVVREKRAG